MYAISLTVSAITYRNFMEPTSFELEVRPSDFAFTDLLDILPISVDHIQNIRNQMGELLLAPIPNKIDRDTVAAHFSTILADNVLSPGFSVAPKSKERDRWLILSNANLKLAELPFFASTDVLQMNASVLRNWNLAILMTRPFIIYENFHSQFEKEEVMQHIQQFEMVLPHRIGTGNSERFQDSIGRFLLSEIESFNEFLAFLKRELSRFRTEWASRDALTFAEGQIPRRWRRASGLWTTRNIEALESYLIARQSQVRKWLTQGKPTDCDMRLVDDPRFMLESFHVHCALHLGEEVTYNFRIVEEHPEVQDNTLYLTGIRLVAGEVVSDPEGSLVMVNDPMNRSPVRTVMWLVCRIVTLKEAGDGSKGVISLPLYKRMITKAMDMDYGEAKIVDGQSSNLVWMIDVPTSCTRTEVLLNGTCMFCQMTDQLA
jgi:hypothetical protein